MSPLASLFAIPFPNIDPVALQLGPISVKWYGLAYMAGLLLGWLYIRRLVRNPRLWPGGQPPFGLESVEISVSIGGGVWPAETEDIEELFRIADRRLYAVKGAAGDGIAVEDDELGP